MFIELLVVGVILAYLYGTGLIRFDNPYAIAISIAVAFTGALAGYLVTHFVARRLVDSMFGFDQWSPRVKKVRQKPGAALTAGINDASEERLRKLVEQNPKDPEISKIVAEIYLQRGLVDRFTEERLRLIGTGILTREQICTIYNRIADVQAAAGMHDEAVRYLQQVIIQHPGTVEAANAEKRCLNLTAESTGSEMEKGGRG